MQRVAIVTGGTRGIGASISIALRKAGYKVGAVYQDNAAAAEALSREYDISVFQWDVSDFSACQKGLEKVTEHLGPIDILVNNAGITRDGMFHKMTLEQWHQVIYVNLSSCFNMSRCVIESMRARAFGRIINLSSVNAQKGQLGQTNYCASKAGILGFTKALALECASKNITVNAVCPGYTETDMVKAVGESILTQIIGQIPVGRLGHPDEVARLVVFLAQDSSGFITGTSMNINGGQWML